MSFSWTRVRAISVKELRDYRRNRFVVGTMTVLPLLFIILPLIQVFDAYAHVDSSNLNRHVGLSMLYMLLIPAFLPSTLSAYSVVGEREQGTLEPVLITPIRREEFLVGKALAAFVPTLVLAYVVFGIFLAAASLFAHPVIASAIYSGTHVLLQLLFTPLLVGWGIWIGIAVSARSSDVRVAQQLSVLAHPATAGHPGADLAERHHRVGRRCDRPGHRPAGHRPARLAGSSSDVRPRTTYHGRRT